MGEDDEDDFDDAEEASDLYWTVSVPITEQIAVEISPNRMVIFAKTEGDRTRVMLVESDFDEDIEFKDALRMAIEHTQSYFNGVVYTVAKLHNELPPNRPPQPPKAEPN